MKAHFSVEDKLSILQKGDPFHHWTSLNDRRVCVLCEKSISGREIGIKINSRGKPRLYCPTKGCQSGPREWVLPGNPLTSERAWRDWSRLIGVAEENPVG